MPRILSRIISRLVMEMVTTRITDAFPITSPRAVRKLRTLFAHNDCTLNRSASRINISWPLSLPSGALRIAEQLFGLFARRIVGREFRLQITFQQDFGLIQIALLLHIGAGPGENHLGTIGLQLLGLLENRLALLILAMAGQIAR